MKDTKRRKEVDAQDDTSQQVELLNARVQQLIESSASRRPIFALNRAAIPSESHASSASSAGSAYPEAFSRPGRHSLDLGVRSRYNTADTNVMNPFRVATGDEPLLSHSSQSISLRDTIPVSGFPMVRFLESQFSSCLGFLLTLYFLSLPYAVLATPSSNSKPGDCPSCSLGWRWIDSTIFACTAFWQQHTRRHQTPSCVSISTTFSWNGWPSQWPRRSTSEFSFRKPTATS